MELHGLIQTFPKYVKLFIASFVVVLSIGYSTGLLFVRQTQSVSPDGIEQNYLGNEDIENVKVMKFEKGDKYIGQFDNDLYHGTGVWHSFETQTKRQGEWKNGKRI